MLNRQWFFALAVLLVAVPVFGQGTPVAANSTAVLNSPHPAVSIFVVPNGSGSPLMNCFGPGGVPTSATIVATFVDASGVMVPGVPQRDIRLEHLNSPMSWCSDAFYPPPPHAANCADGPSNLAGQATFSLAYHGGGQQFQNCRVWVLEATGSYQPLPQVLPVSMNSPDLSGDLAVNLSDIVLFTQDLQGGGAPYRSDFNWDGAINLTDIAMFAQTLATSCP